VGTLSDRIGDLEPKGKYENEDWATGFYAGTEEAANLAKEADELMDEMAKALEHIWHEGEPPYSEVAAAALLKFDDWKEQNQ
jgi:hypothetical protein